MTQPHLLILDDHIPIAMALCDIVRSTGWQVTMTTDPEEALGLMRQRKVDVLLVDYVMPGICGLDLIQIMRQEYLTLPILIMSGHSPKINPSQAQHLGILKVLRKPFEPELLIAALQEASSSLSTVQTENND